MKPIIKIENLSKIYRLGEIGTGTLSHDLRRWYYKIRGWEDPYLKIGETNELHATSSNYVWALKDINLEIMPGEVLGIIGKNGAGKSTLLKILSKVTGPTTGKIDYNGRIGALLEVGTGFHPELTGRENIFLNGAILGMSKQEIKNKLDEIIDFSGVERYIDTPVKRYSSGMMVRLGFAVAAHLDPEILIVDEVLAVGDAEFQKKAIAKMQEVSEGHGRTILFVSHNMFSVKMLCNKGVLLKNGEIYYENTIEKTVEKYKIDNFLQVDGDLISRTNRKGSGKIKATKCILKSSNMTGVDTITCGDRFLLELELTRCTPNYNAQKKVEVVVNICNLSGDRILLLSNRLIGKKISINNEKVVLQYRINKLPLNPGSYYIRLLVQDEAEILDWIDHSLVFNVEKGDFYGTGYITDCTVFYVDHTIEVMKSKNH